MLGRDIQQFEDYLGRVQIRRDLSCAVRPVASALDGREVQVQALYQLDDAHQRYPGEWVMAAEDGSLGGIHWIASGDLADLRPA